MLALDAHAGVHRAHVTAGIGAGAAGALADLLDQARLEAGDIGVGEEAVDAAIGATFFTKSSTTAVMAGRPPSRS
jgi:hypothetical protein